MDRKRAHVSDASRGQLTAGVMMEARYFRSCTSGRGTSRALHPSCLAGTASPSSWSPGGATGCTCPWKGWQAPLCWQVLHGRTPPVRLLPTYTPAPPCALLFALQCGHFTASRALAGAGCIAPVDTSSSVSRWLSDSAAQQMLPARVLLRLLACGPHFAVVQPDSHSMRRAISVTRLPTHA